jgi:hypothetical protein
MTRLAATLASPVSLWAKLSTPFRAVLAVEHGLGDFSGLAAVERNTARIQRSSRHWLM